VTSPPDLLRRTAVTLRERIGPAVDEPFARTQAFMAAVVLEKLAGQLAAATADAAAADGERLALVDALDGRCAGLDATLDALRVDGSDRAWSGLVRATYAHRDELGGGFDDVLTTVRSALRARLDRALAYSA
jgi:hypothetical protein